MFDAKACADFQRQHVNAMSKVYWNTVKFNSEWTDATLEATIAIAKWCRKNKLDFATEVKLKHFSRRADVIIPAYTAQVIEIADSETAESLLSKRFDYFQHDLTMVAVEARRIASGFVQVENEFKRAL